MVLCCTKHGQKKYSSRTSHSHTNEIFNVRDGIMKLEAICHLLICTHQVSLRWSYLLNCKEVVMQQKQKVMTGASSQRWDATRLKKSSVLIMEPQLYSAQTVVKLFYLSWRLVVAKHLGAKVFLFSLSFVFICLTLSAQPWWLLLLMLSASFFLVVFRDHTHPPAAHYSFTFLISVRLL